MQRDKTCYNITCGERYKGTYNNKVEYRKSCVHPKNVPNKWRKMFIHDKTKTNSFKVKLYNDNKQKPKEITKDGWYFPQRTSFHIWQIICCCFKSKLKNGSKLSLRMFWVPWLQFYSFKCYVLLNLLLTSPLVHLISTIIGIDLILNGI